MQKWGCGILPAAGAGVFGLVFVIAGGISGIQLVTWGGAALIIGVFALAIVMLLADTASASYIPLSTSGHEMVIAAITVVLAMIALIAWKSLGW